MTRGRKKLLVFGGTGLLGHHFHALAKNRDDLHLTLCVRNQSLKSDLANEKVSVVNFDNWSELNFGHYDHVINMIGLGRSSKDDLTVEESNFRIGQNIFVRALETKAKHFIHISSIATRSGHQGPINDHTPIQPRPTAYAHAKARLERSLISMEQTQFPVSILSPTYMIGTGDRYLNSNGIFLHLFFRRLNGYLDVEKNFVSPRDVAKAILLTMDHPQTRSMIISGHNIKIGDFFRLSCEKMKLNFKPKPYSISPADISLWEQLPAIEKEFSCPSLVEASMDLGNWGYRPSIDIETMIEEALQDLRQRRLIPTPNLGLTIHAAPNRDQE